jgi:hypothetical protein
MTATATKSKRVKQSRKAYPLIMRVPHDWIDAAQDIDADMTPSELFRDILHPILAGEINIVRNHAGIVTGFVPSPHRKRRSVSDVPRLGRPKNEPDESNRKAMRNARAHTKEK